MGKSNSRVIRWLSVSSPIVDGTVPAPPSRAPSLLDRDVQSWPGRHAAGERSRLTNGVRGGGIYPRIGPMA
eukprot:1190366-Prorocentrum_minimum.AAC.9